MRLIDADTLIEHTWKDRVETRGLITEMINRAPTVVPTISEGATNGEVLQSLFPSIKVREKTDTSFIEYTLDGLVGTMAEKKWWNALYKIPKGIKEGE